MNTVTSNTIQSEVRATSATGGQKGRKAQEMALLPWRAIWAISEVYSYGAKKYSAHNWRSGYPWSWSFDALQRHLTAWWDGEDKDPESGLSHLAHAGFHILSLLWYSLVGRGTDDRWKPAQATLESSEKQQVLVSIPPSDPPFVAGDCVLVDKSIGLKGLAAYTNQANYPATGDGLVCGKEV